LCIANGPAAGYSTRNKHMVTMRVHFVQRVRRKSSSISYGSIVPVWWRVIALRGLHLRPIDDLTARGAMQF